MSNQNRSHPPSTNNNNSTHNTKNTHREPGGGDSVRCVCVCVCGRPYNTRIIISHQRDYVRKSTKLISTNLSRRTRRRRRQLLEFLRRSRVFPSGPRSPFKRASVPAYYIHIVCVCAYYESYTTRCRHMCVCVCVCSSCRSCRRD